MKLCEAESLGMFDDDDACLRHIDADLDNSGRHKQLRSAVTKPLHRRIAVCRLHLAMRQCHFDIGKGTGQRDLPVLGGGHIDLFRFLDQRTDPVGTFASRQRSAKPVDHIREPVKWQRTCVDGKAAGRLFIKPRMIKVAIGCHGQ